MNPIEVIETSINMHHKIIKKLKSSLLEMEYLFEVGEKLFLEAVTEYKLLIKYINENQGAFQLPTNLDEYNHMKSDAYKTAFFFLMMYRDNKIEYKNETDWNGIFYSKWLYEKGAKEGFLKFSEENDLDKRILLEKELIDESIRNLVYSQDTAEVANELSNKLVEERSEGYIFDLNNTAINELFLS